MRNLTSQEVEDMVSQYSHGTSVKDLSNAYGISESKVWRWILTDWYFYLKIARNTGNSQTGFFKSFITSILTVGIFIKVFGITNYGLIIAVGVFIELSELIIGILFLKYGLATREISINNRYDREKMGTYHATEALKKKEKVL